jgi:site-specific DNA recombinase
MSCLFKKSVPLNRILKIARGLEADGILNGSGHEKRHTSNINWILRNEKYIGNAF